MPVWLQTTHKDTTAAKGAIYPIHPIETHSSNKLFSYKKQSTYFNDAEPLHAGAHAVLCRRLVVQVAWKHRGWKHQHCKMLWQRCSAINTLVCASSASRLLSYFIKLPSLSLPPTSFHPSSLRNAGSPIFQQFLITWASAEDTIWFFSHYSNPVPLLY